MSQIADITLADSVPTVRTFEVAVKDGLEAKWIYNNGSSLSLRPFASIKMRLEDSNKNIARKSTIQVVVPYSETVDSVDVTRYATARIEFITPESASATNIADLFAFSKEALTETLVSDMVTDSKFPY